MNIHPQFAPFLPCVIQTLKEHHVKTAYLFGSVLTDRFNEQSDIDILLDFQNVAFEDYVSNYFHLQEALSSLTKRDIDLLELRGIKNSILRNNIDKTKKLIYGTDTNND